MIKVENLSYEFPKKDLYKKISFTLEDGQHCAFIGTSGSGKSTLINILMDPYQYMYDGDITMDANRRIGYVSQFSQLDKPKETTVFEYIAEDFLKLEKEIHDLCVEMETSTDIEPLLEKYQNALDAFDAIGGDDYDSNIKKKLNIADLLKTKDLFISEISGGEFKLVQVIKEMLLVPELLIMDEPDVFLDFDNLNSLKNLINAHKRILLIITHNRFLLNNCFNKIMHLEDMALQEFDGKYIDYTFHLLQTKIDLQELSAADDEEIERNEILIHRLRTIATNSSESAKGKSLKARVKIQERLEARRTMAPFVEIKQPYINFTAENPIAEDVTAIKVTGYKLEFDDVLIEDGNFEIKASDKVALIGLNGTGKTTLLREIFNKTNPSIEINEDITMNYLSQRQGEMLNEEHTILEEFFDAGFSSPQEIRSYLFSYGFDAEFVEQKISKLSGGEKNILQLAKVAYTNANLLLLDEPTSHLDTYSQIALEDAITNYKGTVVMVSHDYYSIINCMDYVLMIEDNKIRKMRMRTFRKMIYKSHFDKDYLEMEQKKKAIETKVAIALKNTNFELAKVLAEELKAIIEQL